MTSSVYVAGVGMIPFVKPGANAPYPVMGAEATALALADAGIGYDMVQQAYVGYVYGDSTCGQRALYEVGMTGIPIVNVNNNCSTGSTALFLARQAIAERRARLRAGARLRADEARRARRRLHRPARARSTSSTPRPTSWSTRTACRWRCATSAAPASAHMKKYGTHAGDLRQGPRQGEPACREQSAGAVPQGSHRRRRDERPGDLARRDDAPDGLPADLRRAPRRSLVSEEFASKHGLRTDVRIAGAGDDHRHRLAPSSAGDMMQVVGFDMARAAAQARSTRPPASAPRISTSSSCTTASRTTS